MSSQADMATSVTSAHGLPKIAIPRVRRLAQGQITPKERRRVSRACTQCRNHKIKCSGERPHCGYCSSTKRECVYVISRKDKVKSLTEQCQQMAAVLQGLKLKVSAEDSAKITDVLEVVEEDVRLRQSTTSPSPSMDVPVVPGDSGLSGGFLRPNERHDEYAESLDENLRQSGGHMPGFIGRSSDVQWLHTAMLVHRKQQEPTGHGISPLKRQSLTLSDDKVSSFVYWTDDEKVDLDDIVDQYELPQPDTAQQLLECYMLRVHDSFPILARKSFEDQFQRHFAAIQTGIAPRVDPGWQALLNMIFAIGARYSHLAQADWRADDHDHLLYQARARTFGVCESPVTTHPDIPRVQSLGLLSFYWLSVGQVSRAWMTIGSALRSAYSLGLHVRNEDPFVGSGRRETLIQLWWSMCSLERTLCIITGRPSIINALYYSVPLPQPSLREYVASDLEAPFETQRGPKRPISAALPSSARSGLYFAASVRLSLVTQDILTWLYSVNALIRSVGDSQQQVAQLSERLDGWMMSLPVELNPQQSHMSNNTFQRECSLLSFQLCSARMLLARPCMSEPEQALQNEKEASFARHMANSCVDAASTVIELLPNEPRLGFIYDQYPWWSIVYHIMQAVSVLLLGIAYPLSISRDRATVVGQLRKAVCWLQILQDPVAKRAYRVAVYSFESIMGQHPQDGFDSWAPAWPNHVALLGSIVQPAATAVGMGPYVPLHFDPTLPAPGAYSNFAADEGGDDRMAGDTYTAQHDHSMFNAPYYTNR